MHSRRADTQKRVNLNMFIFAWFSHASEKKSYRNKSRLVLTRAGQRFQTASNTLTVTVPYFP